MLWIAKLSPMEMDACDADNWRRVFSANYRLLCNGAVLESDIAAQAIRMHRIRGSSEPAQVAREAWGEPMAGRSVLA